ncbi:MAG: hypothetical protein AAB584_02335 [Patescibacteria group bacterium]
MKSIERRFKNITEKNPYWSSYTCFFEAIKGQGFGKQAIHRWFNKLVDKDDYAKNEKKGVLAHLRSFSKRIEDDKK